MEKPLTVRHMDVHQHLRDPSAKQEYVTTVFQIVASSYDRFTRWCSFGRDRAWKRQLIQWLLPQLQATDHLLDVATGTGHFAFALAPALPRGRVMGLDISENMIRRAREAAELRRAGLVEFVVGDMMRLPVADRSIDAITVGYGLRNCPDARAALHEMARALKPGGYLAVLEFVRPESGWWAGTFRHGLLWACQFFGWLWHREPAVYGYLAHSLAHWFSRRELADILQQAGFVVLQSRSQMMGTVCILLAQRAPAA